MRFVPGVSVALALAAAAVAQNCNVAPAQRTFSNRSDFIGSFYYTIGNHLFDLNVQRPISISQIATWTYDQGVGNPVVPNQVGNTAQVDVYTCPTTRVGNETNAPTNPGSPWTLLGSGMITIVATPGESAIVFNPPLALPAGQYGVALNYLPSTMGMNPGGLHCLGLSPNPAMAVSDQFLTFSNDGIQQTAWAGNGQDSPNLRITYTPDAASAHYTNLGTGCYDHPYPFYEVFQGSASAPNIANTSQTWVNVGNNYVIASGGLPYTAPSSTPLTAGATGSSSSGNWDDALSTPMMLPFTFNYPGGSTNMITIGSNGYIYLDAVVNNTYNWCGAAYGSLAVFRDNAGRISPYFHDLDPSAAGAIYYDASANSVTITWANVPEWNVPATSNTMQLTLDAAGTVFVTYGNLGNTAQEAYWGFTPGNGTPLPAPINIQTLLTTGAMQYTSGDGAYSPTLSLDARPVIGTTVNFTTSNVIPGTIVQVLAAGDSPQPFPVNLNIIGMPDCFLQVNFIVLLTGIINMNNEFVQPLTLPNNPSLQNAQLVVQAAPLSIGYNPLGFLLSNGICGRVGL